MKKHYEKIILYSDRKTEEIMNQQVMDQSSEFYGGFHDHDGLVEPKLAIFQVTTMTACLFNRQSCFYGSEIVYNRITIALTYIVRGQRENGFFDLINCNFYSGADTAFCLDGLLPAYIYLDRLSQEEDCSAAEKSMLSALLPVMKSILVKGGKAMIHGGFHTPNHRWAIASVLMMLYRLTADESMKQGAEKFLIEGCDCNDDGEYAERSAGGYNLVNNNAMMMLAAATGDDSWYEPVKRNLAMMLHYIEPDGSIFTNNSTRQDRGNKIYPTGYYLEYLYMGIKFHNETFLQTACFIMDQAVEKGIGPLDWLIHFMLHPELREFEYDNGKILKDYCHHYTDSGIVRLRRESYSCSLLKDSPSFLYFQHGDLCVSMKIGASFCEHRYFVPENLVQLPENEGFVLNQKMAGWYYLPFKEPQDTTDWWQMDHTKREKLNGPDMNFVITATEVKDGMDITIETAGIDRAPVRIELAFDAGCRVESPYFISEGNAGGGIVAKEGIVTASKGKYAITAGPGFGTHNYVAGKFGSQGRSQDCYTVCFTDFTCFKHTISLRAVPSAY